MVAIPHDAGVSLQRFFKQSGFDSQSLHFVGCLQSGRPECRDCGESIRLAIEAGDARICAAYNDHALKLPRNVQRNAQACRSGSKHGPSRLILATIGFRTARKKGRLRPAFASPPLSDFCRSIGNQYGAGFDAHQVGYQRHELSLEQAPLRAVINDSDGAHQVQYRTRAEKCFAGRVGPWRGLFCRKE